MRNSLRYQYLSWHSKMENVPVSRSKYVIILPYNAKKMHFATNLSNIDMEFSANNEGEQVLHVDESLPTTHTVIICRYSLLILTYRLYRAGWYSTFNQRHTTCLCARGLACMWHAYVNVTRAENRKSDWNIRALTSGSGLHELTIFVKLREARKKTLLILKSDKPANLMCA